MSDHPTQRPPAAAGVPRGPWWQVVLAALLPGSVHVLRGKRRFGILVLAFTLFTWFAVIHASEAFLVSFSPSAPWDHWLASATALVVILGAAIWAARDARRGDIRRTRREGISEVQLAMRQFRKNRMAVIGLNLVLLLALVALLAPYLTPYDPDQQHEILEKRYMAPNWEHLLGTDRFSRDVFSRLLYGTRISLVIGFLAVGISITLGTLLGAVAGFVGGAADATMMRFVDLLLSFPRLVLLLVIIAFFQRSVGLLILVLGFTGWMGTTRIVRSQVLSLREQDFIQACRALGAGPVRTILRHLIPNALAPVIVAATLGIGATILVEASLSFLGLGVPPPTSTWGTMVAEERDALVTAWWASTFPGLAIVFTVMAFNLLGDGLRDALDPRMRS